MERLFENLEGKGAASGGVRGGRAFVGKVECPQRTFDFRIRAHSENDFVPSGWKFPIGDGVCDGGLAHTEPLPHFFAPEGITDVRNFAHAQALVHK